MGAGPRANPAAWDWVPATELLTEPECWRRVAGADLGRIAFLTEDAIRVYPVAYAARDQRVYLRTSPYSELALQRDGRVTFEVEEVDSATRSGWTVLLTGSLDPVADPYEIASVWTTCSVRPWADGWREHTLRLTPESVSGVAVHGSPTTQER